MEVLNYHKSGLYISAVRPASWRFEAKRVGSCWEVSDNRSWDGFVRVTSLREADRWCEERFIGEQLG